jgi:hypothetical protein
VLNFGLAALSLYFGCRNFELDDPDEQLVVAGRISASVGAYVE